MQNTLINSQRKLTRKAKEKATLEIARYFRPKNLQTIPENSEVVHMKKTVKDKNNNPKKKTKKNSKHSAQKQYKSVEKAAIDGTKLKSTSSKSKSGEAKTTTTKNGSKQPKESSSKGSSSSSLNDVVLDSPVVSSNLVLLDSSIESNETTYDFDALQTDDPTDEEIDYELPDTKKPYWSLFNNRIAIVIDQTKVKADVVDTLFGSGHETVMSQEIFPKKTPIQRRRSTAVWRMTPLRYIPPRNFGYSPKY